MKIASRFETFSTVYKLKSFKKYAINCYTYTTAVCICWIMLTVDIILKYFFFSCLSACNYFTLSLHILFQLFFFLTNDCFFFVFILAIILQCKLHSTENVHSRMLLLLSEFQPNSRRSQRKKVHCLGGVANNENKLLNYFV